LSRGVTDNTGSSFRLFARL